MVKFAVLSLALVLILAFAMADNGNVADAMAANRKPPINGSIFGKRTSEAAAMDSSPGGGFRPYNSYGSFCEMAWDTCFAQYVSETMG